MCDLAYTSTILSCPFWRCVQNAEDTLTKEQLAQYRELDQRRQRLKELERVAARMQTKKNLTVREQEAAHTSPKNIIQ